MHKRHHNCLWNVPTEKKIVKTYQNGSTMDAITKKFGGSRAAVRNVLIANGIVLRPRSETLKGRQNARKHTVNQNFFEAIEEEAQAYVLGLIFSDGWVRGIDGIGISSTDPEIPYIVKDTMAFSGPVNQRKPTKGRKQWEVFIASRKIVTDIKKHECTPRKSNTLKFPKTIPNDLLHHFVRGLWDGDGSISFDKRNNAVANLRGTYDVLYGVSEILRTRKILRVNVHNPDSTHRIELHGNGRVSKLRKFLYNESTLFLPRKKEKFDHVRTIYDV